MNAQELTSFADLVAELVLCRLQGDDARIDRLFADLTAISDRRDARPALLARVRRVFDDHDFERVAGEIDRLPRTEAAVPPDDLARELARLADKLRGLLDEDSYEYKLPHRVQINVDTLVSILLEILDILKKLARRSQQPPSVDAGGLSVGPGVVMVREQEVGPPSVLFLPDRFSVSVSGLDADDLSVANLAFDSIGDRRVGDDCVKAIRTVSGGQQIRCTAAPCADGCRILRHPVGGPADPDRVQDVTPGTPGAWVTMNPAFFYWCRCGAD